MATDIGFDFWYLGVRYTQFSVSTNGFIDFSSSTADGGPYQYAFSSENETFSIFYAPFATQPAIAALYDDLIAQSDSASLGNSIRYLVSGSPGSRTLTVEWTDMGAFSNFSPDLNFQIKLVESTGQIIIHYGSMNPGNNTFSYSMGLNAPVLSNPPTTAELKALQTVNANTFSNAAQNVLSAMPANYSQYIFTPIAPTPVSGNLTFPGVSQTGMTLNWTNWASNELGYVIYNSTDNINFDFVTQTAANATSFAATNLLPGTTYYWRVYAVTEGCLSAALTGTQATSAAGNKISILSGNWSNANIWLPVGVPTVGDNVTISSVNTVAINVNANCNNLLVAGPNSVLNFSGATALSLSVNNLTINSGATFSTQVNSNVTHSINLKGNIVNNGVLNFATDANSLVNANFMLPQNYSITGSGGTTNFNRITETLGSINRILEISSSNFSAPADFLSLNSGTFKMSTVNSVSVTPFSTGVNLDQTKGLWLNSPNLFVLIPLTVPLAGKITISSGTLNIGNAADEDLVVNGGRVEMYGGLLKIAGNFDGSNYNNSCYFSISSGTLIVPTYGSSATDVSPFHIASPGSGCNMSGGTIVIERAGGGAQNLGFYNVNTDPPGVTGSTLQIGDGLTPAAQIIGINTNRPIQNLLINSANATALLNTNTLTVNNNVNIALGRLNANNVGLNVGGNWTDSGTLTPGTSTVVFNGTSAQAISKAGGETFYAVQFAGVGTKTLSIPITANNNFSIAAGAGVDVSASNFSLTVKGNFINNGVLNARSGVITFNGTATQTIGGATITDFYDITLNNPQGALLSNAENLKGTLTLTNGNFITTSQVFTMLSDAAGTARIAQITGGNFVGNVTIQRFAPGGTTGWALLGSPISSALKLNDWDDDIYISCNTCPDGSAAGFSSVYTYNETLPGLYDAAASYVPLGGINDPIVPTKGYWVYLGTGSVTTTDITLDLTGTPGKFNTTIPLNYTNYGSAINDGWNLISNPYPSAISWAGLKGATANIDNAIYCYNADLNAGSGGFASYVNGVSSPAVGSGGVGDVIPMGQGFYVHSTGATALTAQESNKVASNPTFLRPTPVNSPLMRLTLNGVNASTDETVLYFEPGANPYFDIAYDSYKMRGQDPYAPSIALEDGPDVFQINGIAPVVGNFTMSLKALTGSSGMYTITANNINSFPNGACISLYDKFTAVTTDLRASDYVFNLMDTTTVSRFILSITMNPLNITAINTQPSCQLPLSGKVIAVGNNAGPWNYYWTSNGSPVKTSLNKATADTLSGLSGGNFELSVNTVAMCDNNQSVYTIYPQQSSTAAFSSVDTLYLDNTSFVQFTNNSINSVSSYWDFGIGQNYSTVDSPLFSYPFPGIYTVSLIAESSTGCKDTAYKRLTVISGMVGLQQRTEITDKIIVKSLENNLFNIELTLKQQEIARVRLTDATGKLIVDYGTKEIKNLNLQVDLKDHARGLYFLTILSDSGQKVIKLPVK